MGCVYFFKHKEQRFIKIGMSSKDNPYKRFSQFLTYAPLGGEILGYFNTPDAALKEAELHEKFKDKRMGGEWFDIDYRDIEYLIYKYNEASRVKRILCDIPLKIDEEDKNTFDLECIRGFHYGLALKTSGLDYRFLVNVLLRRTKLSEIEIKDIDVMYLYMKYFECNEN